MRSGRGHPLWISARGMSLFAGTTTRSELPFAPAAELMRSSEGSLASRAGRSWFQRQGSSMEIDGTVLYQGRPYIFRGFDPVSVSPRQANLEDAKTGSEIALPLDEAAPVA